MENNLITISNVRGYVDENGTAMLNAEDVARGWGFVDVKDGNEYVRWARVNSYLSEYGFSPQVAKDDFIPEGMVYRLGFKASNEKAQKFQAILADEVIPSIRKHGAYMNEETLEKALTSPDFLIKLATELKQEKQKRLEAEQQIERDRPLVIFGGAVSCSGTCILVGELAKLLRQNGINIGQNRLFKWLRDNGYLIKNGSSKNMPTQRAMEMGLFTIKEGSYVDSNGVNVITKTPKVTGKGQIYFLNKFLSMKDKPLEKKGVEQYGKE